MDSKSKYTHDDRKYIVQLIENLKNNEDYVAIFEILTADASSSYTQNSNGIFLNLSVVSDKTMDKINKYLKKIYRKNSNQIHLDVDIIPNIDVNTSRNEKTYKLSNYEKNIIKQRNLKKLLNEEKDYQELEISKNKKKSLKSKSLKNENA